jgi:hypothetical protein
MQIWYYRYRIDNLLYWGITDQIEDDPDCYYVAQFKNALPEYNPMTHAVKRIGNEWVVVDL